MFLPISRQRGRPNPGFPQAAGRAAAGDPWRLVFTTPEPDPGAREYGLLDPRLAEEPEPPRDGLLREANVQPESLVSDDLPVPARKPPVPFRLDDGERQAIVDRLIGREGGYVDSPTDPGGPTNYGVTQIAIDDYNRLMRLENGTLLNKVPAAISRAEAEAIHKKLLAAYRFDQLQNATLREQIFDMSTNHGPGTAVTMVQEVLNRAGYPVTIDGVMGPETRRVLDRIGGDADARRAVNNDLVSRRRDLYRQLIRNDPRQQIREKGWMDRAESFRILPPPVY